MGSHKLLAAENSDAKFCIPSRKFTGEDVRQLRQALRKTQQKFSEEFAVPLSTLIAWEQGVRTPSKKSVTKLKSIQTSNYALLETA